jgi:hypothetical protein
MDSQAAGGSYVIAAAGEEEPKCRILSEKRESL